MTNDKFIDLHIHSNNSDGTFAPKQLVDIAEKNNVGILSITDHDSISGLDEFKCNIPYDMLGVKGIEFSSFIIDNNEKIKYSKENIDELRNYYKINRFSYGSDYDLDAKRVIDAIHSASGYVVFAHPMAYKFSSDKDRIERIIKILILMGIDGIEIYQSDCMIKDIIWLGKIANENNLLFSVGSDFHRIKNSDGRQIGLGINNNLCITETSLTNEIIKSKKYFRKVN